MISIVIAEDQTMVLGAVAALLGLEEDMQVIGQATNGHDAIKLVETLRPNVIVSDIEMPGCTGIEVARHIHAHNLPTQVLIVTTFGRPGYLRRAMEASVRGYLLKDSPIEVLSDAVRQVAAGRNVLAPELIETAWDAQPDPLNEREREILRLAEEGLSNKAIGLALNLSPGTVRNYLSESASKLGAANRIEAGRIARANGWL
ncbi:MULTISPECIES: response regulator transcription factor [Komagataeibacter]|uniref:DNA-binding response regulator n=2 Tax=Komagataeibacter TaxID=1434011 RepID=A0A318QRQ5_9PROT|nr:MULTISPECIES: response regulator transcription factor [Komagataeibacter]GBR28754.1 two component response regulator [Komagataeibacter oboediens DSM 11826]MBL7232703.1 response regulator transcription factor [Komagataeibacter oboediens]MBT0676025.1 response regulator transcription factor [Komagataeibacter oboediens]MBT0679588.1 response regulator transcription factor [Komagataeibacter oboediens]MBV1824042.1 response regulator transcription factor [Komagataeibacter oboediens]